MELFLPVALSAALLLLMAGYTRYWDLRTPAGLGVFGLLLVVISLVISIRVDAFTLARRARRGQKQILNRADSRSRLMKFILGGVVIPIAALAAATLVELPNHQTAMSMAIRFRLARPAVARAQQLGDAVLRAQSPAAKAQGIQALEAMRSGDAVEQLLRILGDDPAALQGGSEYQALSKALASQGAEAKIRLLQRFDQVGSGARGSATAPPGDLFELYFSADFEGLKREIERESPPVPAGDVDRLQGARSELQRALSQVETDTRPGQANTGLPAFILQTFLQMDVKQDSDLLAFARQTGADTAWSDAVRGHALLLIAKLGGKDDLDLLYGYLDSSSPLLQARAMQAITVLQSKLSAAAPSE